MPGTQRRGTGKTDPLQARALARLNEVVDEKGITQADIAERSGFTQGHVSRVLSGAQSETAFWVIARIAKALAVSLDWLVEDPRAPRKPESEQPESGVVPSGAPIAR